MSEIITANNTCSIEYEDVDGRTPIMFAAMLNKDRKLRILQEEYLS